VIPGNDDAIRAVKLISQVMANALIEGNQGRDAQAAAAEEEVIIAEEEAEANRQY
jgi:small subunit ribosomal protein S2